METPVSKKAVTNAPKSAPAKVHSGARLEVSDSPLRVESQLAPALRSEQTEYLKQAFVRLFSIDDMMSTGVQEGNARVISAILDLSMEDQAKVDTAVKIYCGALENKYLYDELGTIRDNAVSNVGAIAYNLWAKATAPNSTQPIENGSIEESENSIRSP